MVAWPFFRFFLSKNLFRLRLQLRHLLVGERQHIRAPSFVGNGDADLLGQDIGFDETEQLGELGAAVGDRVAAADAGDGLADAGHGGGLGLFEVLID